MYLVLLLSACDDLFFSGSVDEQGGQVQVEQGGIRIELGPDYEMPRPVRNLYAFGEDAYSDVKVNSYAACALRIDGEIVCFGGSLSGATHPPPGAFQAFDLADRGGCGVDQYGGWTCWGFQPDRDADWLPGGVDWPQEVFFQISLGTTGACLLRPNGSPHCWGRYGFSDVPAGPFAQITVDFDSLMACGRRADTHAVECWVQDSSGETMSLAGTFQHIDLGDAGLAGVRTDGSLALAGGVYAGQRRIDEFPPGNGYAKVSIGTYTRVALRTNGSLDLFEHTGEPGWNPPQRQYIQIETGNGFACARDTAGKVICFGDTYNWPEP